MLVTATFVTSVAGACSIAQRIAGCQPIAPRELPTGAAPGAATEGVAAGTRQFVWGTGSDRVEQLLEIEFPGLTVADVTVRDQPASVFRLASDDVWDLAFGWDEGGCHYTVFLAPGTSADDAIDYAARY